jgi:hypothetical protein
VIEDGVDEEEAKAGKLNLWIPRETKGRILPRGTRSTAFSVPDYHWDRDLIQQDSYPGFCEQCTAGRRISYVVVSGPPPPPGCELHIPRGRPSSSASQTIQLSIARTQASPLTVPFVTITSAMLQGTNDSQILMGAPHS